MTEVTLSRTLNKVIDDIRESLHSYYAVAMYDEDNYQMSRLVHRINNGVEEIAIKNQAVNENIRDDAETLSRYKTAIDAILNLKYIDQLRLHHIDDVSVTRLRLMFESVAGTYIKDFYQERDKCKYHLNLAGNYTRFIDGEIYTNKGGKFRPIRFQIKTGKDFRPKQAYELIHKRPLGIGEMVIITVWWYRSFKDINKSVDGVKIYSFDKVLADIINKDKREAFLDTFKYLEEFNQEVEKVKSAE